MPDLIRWRALWKSLGGQSNPEPHFEALKALYSESHRAYHTFDHIKDCLNQFDQAQEEAARPDEVELALWLHDIVYDPQAADNEEKSARWAVEEMQQGAISAAVIEYVAGLILATQHTIVPEPDEIDAQLLVDIDLSILGRRRQEFDAYEDKIRQEYNRVPIEAYRRGRAKILESFLARKAIYQTDFFKRRYEIQARKNLRRSIARLQGEAD